MHRSGKDHRFLYVDASKLNLREEPYTTAAILIGIEAPSVMEVWEGGSEWSMVSIYETIYAKGLMLL